MNVGSIRAVVGCVALFLVMMSSASGPAHAAKEFLIQGTVDCGRQSGARCDIGDTVVVWTSDVTGARQKSSIDISWIRNQLDRYDQDDLICIDVRVMQDGTLQGIAISPTCGAPAAKRPTGDNDNVPPISAENDNVPPVRAENVNGPPSSAENGEAVPLLDLSLTKGSLILLGADCPAPIPQRGVCMEWTVVVTNSSTVAATNVTVFDATDDGGVTQFYASDPEAGTTYTPIDPTSGTWDIGTLAPGQSVTLVLYSNAPGGPTQLNCAEVETADPPDVDSTPGNGVVGEDDLACDVRAG